MPPTPKVCRGTTPRSPLPPPTPTPTPTTPTHKCQSSAFSRRLSVSWSLPERGNCSRRCPSWMGTQSQAGWGRRGEGGGRRSPARSLSAAMKTICGLSGSVGTEAPHRTPRPERHFPGTNQPRMRSCCGERSVI